MSAPAAEIPHATGPMSESDAVERMLARSSAARPAEKPADSDPLEAPDPEGGLDVEIDEPGDGTEGDNAQLEGDEFEAGDDPAAASTDPVVKFDDGTEIPLSEVKRGFLRQQDYTRKTQETAELRKSVESERANYLAEKKLAADRIAPLIQHAISIIDNPATQAELNDLRVTDPGAYAVRMMEMQQKRAALAQLDHEQRQMRESAEREEMENFQRERQETAKRSRAELQNTIPAAKKDFDTWYKGVGQYVLAQGIPAEAWDNEVDHRIITLAWKAKQYDEATRKAPATSDRLRNAPQTLRPGAARPPGHAQSRAIREASERAAKSGSQEDAVALRLLKMKARA